MRKIFYIFPFLFLLTACGQVNVDMLIKDKFITDITMSSEGIPITSDATDKGYRNLVDPSYKVFIEFDFRGRTYQKTCEIDEVYWRQIQQGQIFSRETMDGPQWRCGTLTAAIYTALKQQLYLNQSLLF